MSFQLVIAEKPSVARSIAAVIGATEKQNGYWQGSGYLVSWCIGHLVSFAEAGQYDEKYCKWRYEDLPILPQPWQFIVPDEKKQQFEVLDVYKRQPPSRMKPSTRTACAALTGARSPSALPLRTSAISLSLIHI